MTINNSDKCLITFWGTRGSIPTPGRATEKYGGNTPCVSARHGDQIVIFDAGTGIRSLGNELEWPCRDVLSSSLSQSNTPFCVAEVAKTFGPLRRNPWRIPLLTNTHDRKLP